MATFKDCTKHSGMEEEINFLWGSGRRMLYIWDMTCELGPTVSRNLKRETKQKKKPTDIHIFLRG